MRNKKINRLKVLAAIAFAAGPSAALADPSGTATVSNYTLMQSLYQGSIIIQSIGIALGLFLFLSGVFALKRYGEMRTMMSQQMTIAKPLFKMFAGIGLLCLPTMIATVMQAMWGTYDPLSYTGYGNDYDILIPPVIVFVRLIGVGAFIRGWVLLSRCGGGEGGQPGITGKAILHIVGGILCIHIIGTYNLLISLFFS